MAMKLTKREKQVMAMVKQGADVWDYELAQTLRGVQRRAPELIAIGKAMQAPKNGAARQPYFGAILTAAGRKAIGA